MQKSLKRFLWSYFEPDSSVLSGKWSPDTNVLPTLTLMMKTPSI
jgi:hypothetical protein